MAADAHLPLGYLMQCSQASLESFQLSQLNRTSSLQKQLRVIMEESISSEVDSRLAMWVLVLRRLSCEREIVPIRELNMLRLTTSVFVQSIVLPSNTRCVALRCMD